MKDNNNFNRVYEDLIDKHTRKVIVYADAENYICYDKERKIRADRETIVDLFIKGMIVGELEEGSYGVPIGISSGTTPGSYAALSFLKPDADGGIQVYAIYTKEYNA